MVGTVSSCATFHASYFGERREAFFLDIANFRPSCGQIYGKPFHRTTFAFLSLAFAAATREH
jgi:hypothetical protein